MYFRALDILIGSFDERLGRGGSLSVMGGWQRPWLYSVIGSCIDFFLFGLFLLYSMRGFLGMERVLHFCRTKQTGGKLAMFTEWLEAEGGSFAKLLTTHWGKNF